MLSLVIVESPVKAKTIGNYLGSEYEVIASKGHIRDLPSKTMAIDIDNNFYPHYINIPEKIQTIKLLKEKSKKADKIYLATDSDREGEAIAWHISTVLGIPLNQTNRVTFNEITKTAVKSGIQCPRSIDMKLVDSQQARRILDRIVGYELSPFLWKNVKSGLSAGRVQSVATKIIVEREKEINNFKPEEYWTITAEHLTDDNQKFLSTFFGKEKQIKITSEESALKILEEIKNKDFVVQDISNSNKKKNPLPPFTTSTLQQDASNKLSFSSSRTMKIAQQLYEGIDLGPSNNGLNGLITYMRTDSLRISEEAKKSARDYILNKYGEKYYPSKQHVYKTKESAQDAHEAIRPTNVNFSPERIKEYLTPEQYKLYSLIWCRFLASQMESAVINTSTILLNCNNYIFKTTGSHTVFDGYLKLYNDVEKDNSKPFLPVLKNGQVVSCLKLDHTQHFTSPPPRYTEGALVKFLEDHGIGRPATYAQIISTITERNYIKKEGKVLIPTELGFITTEVMENNFSEIMDYKFTADMENKLDSISDGNCNMNDVLNSFYTKFKKDLDIAKTKSTNKSYKIKPEKTDYKCELCGSEMVIRTGRFGRFLSCSNYPICKNTKHIDKNGKLISTEKSENQEDSNIICEKCGGKMVLKRSKFGSFYGCSNYPKCKNVIRIKADKK